MNNNGIKEKDYLIEAMSPLAKTGNFLKTKYFKLTILSLFNLLFMQVCFFTGETSVFTHVSVFVISVIPFITNGFLFNCCNTVSEIPDVINSMSDEIRHVYDFIQDELNDLNEKSKKSSKMSLKSIMKYKNIFEKLKGAGEEGMDLFASMKYMMVVVSPLGLTLSLFSITFTFVFTLISIIMAISLIV